MNGSLRVFDVSIKPGAIQFQAQHQLDRLARHHRHQLRQALDLAQKIIEDWSASGMPIDLAPEWTRRLDLIETHSISRKIPLEDRCRLAAFPETVVLTDLILNPPTQPIDPRELYLATTAELSRRFARVYTALGPQDPLYRRFCLYRGRDFRESRVV